MNLARDAMIKRIWTRANLLKVSSVTLTNSIMVPNAAGVSNGVPTERTSKDCVSISLLFEKFHLQKKHPILLRRILLHQTLTERRYHSKPINKFPRPL